jgi:hypothetical protein
MWMNDIEYKKDHTAPPHGLGGYYHLEEELSTIVPRVPQEKDERTICIF